MRIFFISYHAKSWLYAAWDTTRVAKLKQDDVRLHMIISFHRSGCLRKIASVTTELRHIKRCLYDINIHSILLWLESKPVVLWYLYLVEYAKSVLGPKQLILYFNLMLWAQHIDCIHPYLSSVVGFQVVTFHSNLFHCCLSGSGTRSVCVRG